jgi:hypothetical protein
MRHPRPGGELNYCDVFGLGDSFFSRLLSTSPPPLQRGSDDSDGPIQRGARRLAAVSQRVPRSIRIDDTTPTPSPPKTPIAVAPPYQDPHVHGGPIDLLNLWHAVPPNFDHQFLNMSSSHLTDQDDGKLSQCCIYFLKSHDNTEASSSEDGELTPGFVSENDSAENYKETELESLEDCLPLTAQRIRDAQNKRAPR